MGDFIARIVLGANAALQWAFELVFTSNAILVLSLACLAAAIAIGVFL